MTESTSAATPPIGDPAVADLDAGTITRTVRIKAPVSVVWKALTTPEHLERWWGHPTHFPDGWTEGSLGTFEWEGEHFPVRLDVIDPESTFGITWGDIGADLDHEATTAVRFTLRAAGEDTEVTVTETGFDKRSDLVARRAAMEQNVGGWNAVLDSLLAYAEAGLG